MKYLVLAILSFLLSDIRANETPLMSETSKKIRELAALDGFTDQDAMDVSKFLFISLVGFGRYWNMWTLHSLKTRILLVFALFRYYIWILITFYGYC